MNSTRTERSGLLCVETPALRVQRTYACMETDFANLAALVHNTSCDFGTYGDCATGYVCNRQVYKRENETDGGGSARGSACKWQVFARQNENKIVESHGGRRSFGR